MRNLISGIVIVAMSFACLVVAGGQQASTAKSSSGDANGSSVHSISLPQYPPELPPGPGKEAFQKNCLVCHSARYVAMQPGFTKTMWQNEVQKMITAYGAQIPASDKDAIVGYLVSFRGAAENAPAQQQEHAGPK
jgi:mono/diheme cytochrome c family protein